MPMTQIRLTDTFFTRGDSSLDINLQTISSIPYYGNSSLHFDPKILNTMTLEGFQNYLLPQKTNVIISVSNEMMSNIEGKASTDEVVPIKNDTVLFKKYEKKMLTGTVDLDVSSLRLTFPKHLFPQLICEDRDWERILYSSCFVDENVPVHIKVSMPFQIRTD